MKFRRFSAFFLALLLAALCALPVGAVAEGCTQETNVTTILFTHDLHSHFLPQPTAEGGESGGYARLKTVIDGERAMNPDALLVDGGDFSMGTLIQTVYDTEAAELRMLGYLGCDVTTLGNHEFDYGSDGLADMLNAAVSSGENLPRMVALLAVSSTLWPRVICPSGSTHSALIRSRRRISASPSRASTSTWSNPARRRLSSVA